MQSVSYQSEFSLILNIKMLIAKDISLFSNLSLFKYTIFMCTKIQFCFCIKNRKSDTSLMKHFTFYSMKTFIMTLIPWPISHGTIYYGLVHTWNKGISLHCCHCFFRCLKLKNTLLSHCVQICDIVESNLMAISGDITSQV